MKLYYIPTTRAVRPRWLLEELEVPYELIRVKPGMMEEPEHRKLHPHGKVPVLIDDAVTMFESAAICAYLADKYAEKGLAPALTSPARGYYYQWLFYATATLEPPVEQYMFNILPNIPEKVLPKTAQTHLSASDSIAWFERVCQPLNELFIAKDYLVENQFSAADVVMGGVLMWAYRLGMIKEETPIKTYLENLMKRPGFVRADEDFYAKVDS